MWKRVFVASGFNHLIQQQTNSRGRNNTKIEGIKAAAAFLPVISSLVLIEKFPFSLPSPFTKNARQKPVGPGISKEIDTKFKQLTDTHFSSSPCLFLTVNRISVVKTNSYKKKTGWNETRKVLRKEQSHIWCMKLNEINVSSANPRECRSSCMKLT